jgi:hypothetical protein
MPHPLAVELAAAVGAASGARALLLGIGSGRNVLPLLTAGTRVDAIEDDPERARLALIRFAGESRVRVARAAYGGPYPFAGSFDGALSTHALLHGTPHHVAAALAAVRNRLAPRAPLFLTLGSKHDPRFGGGAPVAEDTFVADSGSEAGIPHCYFDEAGARALLAGFGVDSLEERSAAESAGTWAHAADEAAALVHWFARVRRL